MPSTLLAIPVSVVLLLGAVLDVRVRRVPNSLVLAGLPLALLAAAGLDGVVALPGALLAGLIVFALAFSGFALGAIGGGDAKFLVVGALAVGWSGFFPYLLAFGAFGGLLALLVVLSRRAGVEATVMTLDLAKHATSLGARGHRARLGDEDRITVPYAVAIAAAALVTMFTSYAEWLLG